MFKKKITKGIAVVTLSLGLVFSGSAGAVAPIGTTVTVEAASKNMSVKASCGSVYVGSGKKISVKAPKGSKISYKSLNSYVSIDSKGNVKGRKAGTGKVRVTVSKKGYKSATKTVTVKVVKRNQKVSARNVTVNVGKSASLGAKARTGLRFKSSNTRVATVNSRGVVVGKKTGTAKITVYTKGNGTYNKASRTVTVKVTKPSHKHSYKKTVIPAKTHIVEHKEEGHWVEPTWVVDKEATTVVDVPEHDAYVCTDGTEFETEEPAKAHVDEVNAQHVIASKVNKVIHHDAVEEVSHQETVTNYWHVCNVCGFTTPDDSEIVSHQNKFVNMQGEKMDEYISQGMSVDEAQARVDKEIPLHSSTHLEPHTETVKVVDTPAQEAWDEVLEDQYVVTCSCGETFESQDDFNSHKESNSISYELKHIDATYKDVPEEGHYEGERTWVVDKKAYTETVVDTPEKVIYKCSCGAIKK
ncbi:hypothetical protein DWW86_16865 [Ruminococcus sp. AF17-22AC]|uniref:hypothetical protein n=1 Tax=Ruminococcus sp. AF17-22AC TaxID=2292248 RepID=UPI000E505915|nr:hypothetical protein [Ruminococcus sp. AF17-22AC]RGU26544.1 hypothetical protein DWW86_16865 [Ruminococcus sp. AF17-22AC]